MVSAAMAIALPARRSADGIIRRALQLAPDSGNASRAAANVASSSAAPWALRDESGLEGRGREVDAALEHRVEETVEGLAVALHHLGEGRRRRRAEEEPEHAARRARC